MTKLAKHCFLTAIAVLCGLQLGATWLNRNAWPVSSFNVFSAATRGDVWGLRAILIDADGTEVVVDPGRTLPIEFFKARSIYREVFVAGTIAQKEEFAQRLLVRLRQHQWHSFDETLSPAASVNPVRMRVEAWRLDPKYLDPETGFRLTQRVLLYAGPEVSK